MRTAVFLIAACMTLGTSVANAAVTIEKVLPFTPEADSVRIVVTAQGEGELTGTITPWQRREVVWKGSLGKLRPDGRVEKKLEKLKVEAWSPASPNLYELTVSSAGGDGASTTVRFGFRKFEARDGNFYLNGKPIFMRGLAINPPGRGVPDEMATNKQFALDYVGYLRKQNLNLIRLNDDSQEWFDACDELGMMVYQGFYGSPPTGLTKEEEEAEKKAREQRRKQQQEAEADDAEADPTGVSVKLAGQAEAEGKRLPKDFEKSYRAYVERFEAYVHHPSIVIYVLTNEMPYQKEAGQLVHEFLTKMYNRLASWDHTREYIGNAGYGEGRQGTVNDVHRYWGWYYNTFLTYYNLRDRRLFGDYEKGQPLTFSECVGNFTGPTGAYNLVEKKQLAAQLCWTGYSTNQVVDAQRYQAFMNKQAIEIFRRLRPINPRLSGIMPFTITFKNWRGIKSFDEMQPTAAAMQMRTSYSPVLLSFEHWQPQLYAGAETTVIAHVVNDADDFSELKGATLTWTLLNDRRPFLGGKIEVPAVPSYGTWRTPIRLKLPANLPSGEYKVSGRIARGETTVATNETPIFIAGADWKTQHRPPQRKVALYDPPGKTAAALAAMKIPHRRTTDVGSVKDELLIIGQEAWERSLSTQRQKLAEIVKSGGRVLVLGQPHEEFNESWLPVKISKCTDSANQPDYPPKHRPSYDQMVVNPQRPDHPIFAGVDRDRLKFWSDTTGWDESKPGFPNIYPIRYGFVLKEQDELGKVAILADYDRGLEGVAIAEMFDGKGSVLICALDLISRAGVDPVADRMLGNIVEYMASSQPHQIHRLAEGPIKWGDYASMQGFLSGPVQGLFINVVWMPPPTMPATAPVPKEKGSWNSRPGDQFIPQGVRPRGPFRYSTNCIPHDEDKKATTGSGVFWASLPPGRKNVITKVRNPTTQSGNLAVQVNDGDSRGSPVPAGQTITIDAPIPGGARIVKVRYAGEKELVILETEFR